MVMGGSGVTVAGQVTRLKTTRSWPYPKKQKTAPSDHRPIQSPSLGMFFNSFIIVTTVRCTSRLKYVSHSKDLQAFLAFLNHSIVLSFLQIT